MRLIKELPGSRADKDVIHRQRRQRYLDKLTALEKWTRLKVAELPRDKRKLVTSHDAFPEIKLRPRLRLHHLRHRRHVTTEDQAIVRRRWPI